MQIYLFDLSKGCEKNLHCSNWTNVVRCHKGSTPRTPAWEPPTSPGLDCLEMLMLHEPLTPAQARTLVDASSRQMHDGIFHPERSLNLTGLTTKRRGRIYFELGYIFTAIRRSKCARAIMLSFTILEGVQQLMLSAKGSLHSCSNVLCSR